VKLLVDVEVSRPCRFDGEGQFDSDLDVSSPAPVGLDAHCFPSHVVLITHVVVAVTLVAASDRQCLVLVPSPLVRGARAGRVRSREVCCS
jgi:hypothetical protein